MTLTVIIRATRHKHGTWKVHATFPDGVGETHAGLVDGGHAGFVASEVIAKLERNHAALEAGVLTTPESVRTEAT